MCNHLNRNETSFYGKGMRLNYYKKLTRNNDVFEVDNADGSKEIYLLNTFNEKTGRPLYPYQRRKI